MILIEILLVLLCIMQAMSLTLALRRPHSSQQDLSHPASPQLSKEDFEEFSKADQELAQGFLSSLAELNAFMTGNEEVTNARTERQEET